MTWRIPVELMERVDDTTARMLAGTLDDHSRQGEPEITPAKWAAWQRLQRQKQRDGLEVVA